MKETINNDLKRKEKTFCPKSGNQDHDEAVISPPAHAASGRCPPVIRGFVCLCHHHISYMMVTYPLLFFSESFAIIHLYETALSFEGSVKNEALYLLWGGHG